MSKHVTPYALLLVLAGAVACSQAPTSSTHRSDPGDPAAPSEALDLAKTAKPKPKPTPPPVSRVQTLGKVAIGACFDFTPTQCTYVQAASLQNGVIVTAPYAGFVASFFIGHGQLLANDALVYLDADYTANSSTTILAIGVLTKVRQLTYKDLAVSPPVPPATAASATRVQTLGQIANGACFDFSPGNCVYVKPAALHGSQIVNVAYGIIPSFMVARGRTNLADGQLVYLDADFTTSAHTLLPIGIPTKIYQFVREAVVAP